MADIEFEFGHRHWYHSNFSSRSRQGNYNQRIQHQKGQFVKNKEYPGRFKSRHQDSVRNLGKLQNFRKHAQRISKRHGISNPEDN